jgi:hypothetical protein
MVALVEICVGDNLFRILLAASSISCCLSELNARRIDAREARSSRRLKMLEIVPRWKVFSVLSGFR